MQQTEKPKELWIQPGFPPLSRDLIGQAAINGQIIEYPRISRQKSDPPIPSQSFGCYGLKLFSSPRKLSNGKSVYGFIKLRGCFPDQYVSRSKMENIVLDVDSYNLNFIGPVGEWLPITEETSFCREVMNVEKVDEIKKTERKLEEDKNKTRERILQEMREREKELLEKPDPNDNENGLDFYTMKKVTLLSLEQEQKKLLTQTLPNIQEKILFISKKIEELDNSHPQHKKMWIDNWNKERVKAGIPPYTEPEVDKEIATESKVKKSNTLEKVIF